MKKKNLTTPIPVRVDPATAGNLDIIIASGMAADRSAAFRAATAALARALVDDPRVWVVQIDGRIEGIYATEATAIAWLESQGARYDERAKEWYTVDDDGDPFAWYALRGVVPQ